MKKAKRDFRIYLEDILLAIAHVEEYTTKGKRHFFSHEMTQDAVIYNLAIIGEAAKKLPSSLRKKYRKIPWKKVIGMRNIIVHDYSETDIPTIWIVVQRDLPTLKKTANVMLKEQKSTS